MSLKTPFIFSMQQSATSRGFSLVEALVALVILAIGMIGIARMLLLSHKTNSSNYLRQQAVQSGYNIVDRIRANRQAALSGSYTVSNIVSSGSPTIPSTPTANCATSSCSTTQLATYDTWQWLSADVNKLPSGGGSIATAVSGNSTLLTVTVQWNDNPTQQILGLSTGLTQLVIQTQL